MLKLTFSFVAIVTRRDAEWANRTWQVCDHQVSYKTAWRLSRCKESTPCPGLSRSPLSYFLSSCHLSETKLDETCIILATSLVLFEQTKWNILLCYSVFLLWKLDPLKSIMSLCLLQSGCFEAEAEWPSCLSQWYCALHNMYWKGYIPMLSFAH